MTEKLKAEVTPAEFRETVLVKPEKKIDGDGSYCFLFSSEHVRLWGERGAMPKDLVNSYFDKLKKQQQADMVMFSLEDCLFEVTPHG